MSDVSRAAAVDRGAARDAAYRRTLADILITGAFDRGIDRRAGPGTVSDELRAAAADRGCAGRATRIDDLAAVLGSEDGGTRRGAIHVLLAAADLRAEIGASATDDLQAEEVDGRALAVPPVSTTCEPVKTGPLMKPLTVAPLAKP
jgi:hypothetical protein